MDTAADRLAAAKAVRPNAIALILQTDRWHAYGDDARIVSDVAAIGLLDAGGLPVAVVEADRLSMVCTALAKAGHEVNVTDPRPQPRRTYDQGQELTPRAGFSFRVDGRGRLIYFQSGDRLWVTNTVLDQLNRRLVNVARQGKAMGTGYDFTPEQVEELLKTPEAQ